MNVFQANYSQNKKGVNHEALAKAENSLRVKKMHSSLKNYKKLNTELIPTASFKYDYQYL